MQLYVDDGSASAIGYVQIHDYVLSHLYVDDHLQAWRKQGFRCLESVLICRRYAASCSENTSRRSSGSNLNGHEAWSWSWFSRSMISLVHSVYHAHSFPLRLCAFWLPGQALTLTTMYPRHTSPIWRHIQVIVCPIACIVTRFRTSPTRATTPSASTRPGPSAVYDALYHPDCTIPRGRTTYTCCECTAERMKDGYELGTEVVETRSPTEFRAR